MRRFWLLLLLMALWPAPSLGQSFNLPNPPELKILKVNFDKITTNCAESTDGENQECEVFVPWLGNFVSQMYVFAVGLSGIAATIMIMVGGFLWLTAGGNNSQVENAKRYISSALLGLSLMLGSYVILYNVNPKLVRFDALRLISVRHIELGEYLAKFIDADSTIGKCTVSGLSNSESYVGGSVFQSYFVQAGAEFNLDASYLAAVAAAESGYRPNAESPVGALGIMQIMPTTAAEIWKTTSIKKPEECKGENDPMQGKYTPTCKNWMINNPDQSIRMGAAYLQQINTKLAKCNFGGNQTLISAGYNAGPNRKSLCEGDVPPFEETVNYVKRISGFMSGLCRNSGGTIIIDNPEPSPGPSPNTN